MDRYLCIHGHFYQPPRENPWTEAVEVQDSAHPYHDWNERIMAECYAPNASSRLLNEKGLIRRIINNYARMSFNIGPTLMSWLLRNEPGVYDSIIEADRLGAAMRSGHGPAMAQAYNHIISPLANDRDLKTQIDWGIRDFAYRFGRDPEGMWLPEAAVDTRSLEAMAEMGISFTLLAQNQASSTRADGKARWETLTGPIDPARPYLCPLPSGRSITIFFYDGAVSQAVAFEGLLSSGERFIQRLMQGFSGGRDFPQLMHIATDGESYGHHHRFGDMALSYSLEHIEEKGLARLTNYGEFLETHPPMHEAAIAERTSWSCAHGVERWQADCGCSTGGRPEWDQKWRGHLKDALDWLRDRINLNWESVASATFRSPWQARDAYMDVMLNRNEDSISGFLGEHLIGADHIDIHRDGGIAPHALALMEIQRNAMLMYTSCGWFFDDISGIETVQVLRYAGRAIQLSGKALGLPLEDEFLMRLKNARSNIPTEGNGASIYLKHVKPCMVSGAKVTAHYAITSLFHEYGEEADIYCYKVRVMDHRFASSGGMELVMGRCNVVSGITLNSGEYTFGMVHLGGHNLICGVRKSSGPDRYHEMAAELESITSKGSLMDTALALDRMFEGHKFTLNDIFMDERRQVLTTLTHEITEAVEDTYRKVYADNQPLMGFITDNDMPVPKHFLTAASFTLNLELKHLLQGEAGSDEIEEVMAQMGRWNIRPESLELEYIIRKNIEGRMRLLAASPENTKSMEEIIGLVETARSLPFAVDLWMMQNICHHILLSSYGKLNNWAKSGDKEALQWVNALRRLGEKLRIDMDAILPQT